MTDGLMIGATAAMPWLRVDHSHGSPRRLIDEHGRERILRGVNIGVEQWVSIGRPYDPAAYEARCPPNSRDYNQPPVCGVEADRGKYNQSTRWDSSNDFAQIRAVGFNVVRLAVSWSPFCCSDCSERLFWGFFRSYRKGRGNLHGLASAA